MLPAVVGLLQLLYLCLLDVQIIPPGVVFNSQLYYQDLAYRRELDLEVSAERIERLRLLFSTTNPMTDDDY